MATAKQTTCSRLRSGSARRVLMTNSGWVDSHSVPISRCGPAQNLQLGQLISIAPAVNRFGFADLAHPGCPWLVVQGDEDDVVDIDSVRTWVKTQHPEPDFVAMEQADHFFHRRLMDLRGLLKNGVSAQLPHPTGH